MSITHEQEKAALVKLVKRWLPHVEVAELQFQESCGCYSEWTQEPPSYWVTLRAPRPADETDRKLADISGKLEGPVKRFASKQHTFTGCSCCQGDNYSGGDADPSVWVRIIPVRTA